MIEIGMITVEGMNDCYGKSIKRNCETEQGVLKYMKLYENNCKKELWENNFKNKEIGYDELQLVAWGLKNDLFYENVMDALERLIGQGKVIKKRFGIYGNERFFLKEWEASEK